jgi:type IV pilus assembly protein PilC
MAQASAKTPTAAKLATFQWSGTDKKGSKTSGELSGKSVAMVRAELRKQGITVNKVKKKAEPITLFGLGGERSKPITASDIAVFSRQLTTMMKAGIPLVQSFEIVAASVENKSLQKLILALQAEVEAGNTLAASLRKFPNEFDDLFCNLVDAGEQSGALEDLLNRVATYKEKSEALKAKVKKALTYPISVLGIAAVITGILLVKVVPTFQEMFEGFGGELPAATQFVVGVSEFFQAYWWMGIGGGFILFKSFSEARKRSKPFSDRVDEIILKIPIFGDIAFKSVVARFARTLATTFAAGVPMVEALESVAGAAGNNVYVEEVNRIKHEVSSGTQLNFCLQSSGLWPPMLVSMVSIGEESGALDEMLEKVADFYEAEVDDAVDNLTALMEPALMSFLGVVVGGLLISMYLPIFKMGEVI